MAHRNTHPPLDPSRDDIFDDYSVSQNARHQRSLLPQTALTRPRLQLHPAPPTTDPAEEEDNVTVQRQSVVARARDGRTVDPRVRLPSTDPARRPVSGDQRRSGSPPRRNLLQDEDTQHSSRRRPSPPEVRPSYTPSGTQQVSDKKSPSPSAQDGAASLILLENQPKKFGARTTSSTQTHSSHHVTTGSSSFHVADLSRTGAVPPAVVASRTASNHTVSSYPQDAIPQQWQSKSPSPQAVDAAMRLSQWKSGAGAASSAQTHSSQYMSTGSSSAYVADPSRTATTKSPSPQAVDAATLLSQLKHGIGAASSTQTHSAQHVSTRSSSAHVADPSRAGSVPLSAVVPSQTASTRAASLRRQDATRATGSSAAAAHLPAPRVARQVSRANRDQRGLPPLQVQNAQAPRVPPPGVSHLPPATQGHAPPAPGFAAPPTSYPIAPYYGHSAGVQHRAPGPAYQSGGPPPPAAIQVDIDAKHADGKHHCPVCGATFKTQGPYQIHRRTHEDEPFKCPKCGAGYSSISGRQAHCKKSCPYRVTQG